jgi:hypothetical protein
MGNKSTSGLVGRTRIAFVGALAASLFTSPSQVTAQFAPITCSSSSWSTVAGFAYSTDEFASDPNCVASGADPCPHYIPNYQNLRYLLANRYVNQVELRFSRIDTESGYDYLDYGTVTSPSSVTGNPATPSTQTFSLASGDSLQATATMLRFRSDSVVSDEGVTIDQARVRCTATGDDFARLIPWNFRQTGMLLGTNDVVYSTALPSATFDQALAVWGGAAGLNVDVYARCNARPTATTYNYSSKTQVAGEDFIVLPDGTCSGGTWHIAFHAQAGAGAFHFMLSPYDSANTPNVEIATLRVGTGFAATPAQYAALGDTVQRAARMLYGASEGAIQIGTIHMYNNGSCGSCAPGGGNCHICFDDAPGTGQCCDVFPTGPDENGAANPHGRIMILASYTFGYNIAGVTHEMGHGYMSGTNWMTDEYGYGAPPNGWNCGHSIMGKLADHNVCQQTNHGLDRQPGSLPEPSSSGHDDLYNNGYTPWRPPSGYSPDYYDFGTFGFSGFRTALVWH